MIQHCSGFPHTKLLCFQYRDFKRSTLGEREKGERKEGERNRRRGEGGEGGRRERGGRERGGERGGWRGKGRERGMEDGTTKSPMRYLESRPTRISGTLYSGMNLLKKSLVMRR